MKKLFRKFKGGRDGGNGGNNLPDYTDTEGISNDSLKCVVDSTHRPVHRPISQPRPFEGKNDQEDLTSFSGFDTWLSSFAPNPQNLGVSELQGGTTADDFIRIEGFPEYDYISMTLMRARKPNQKEEFNVTIYGPWYMTLDQLNRAMQQHGYRELLLARNTLIPEHMWQGDLAYPTDYQIPVVRSHSCYDPDVGLRINEDQPLHEFVDAVRRLKLNCNDGILMVTSWPASLEIQFNRTLRLPEGSEPHEQPSSMGVIPVHSISGVRQKLLNSNNTSLLEMAKKGGIFFPLYQREAAFLTFNAKDDTFAVRVFVGGVNAVSGLTWNNTPRNQDYLVVPPQSRLDGVVVGNGIVKQFVAMPLGSGYSVEKQVTGKETIGGVQIEITPGNLWKLGCKGHHAPSAYPTATAKQLGVEWLELQPDLAQAAAATVSHHSIGGKPVHELPILLKHFYLDQLDYAMNEYIAYGQQPTHIPGFVPWRPGAHVQMTAIYKLRVTLSWNEMGRSCSTEVEWPPWWNLGRCIQERVEAGFKINDQDFHRYNLYGPSGTVLFDSEDWNIEVQGVCDRTTVLVRHKNEPPPVAGPYYPPAAYYPSTGGVGYQAFPPQPPVPFDGRMASSLPQQPAMGSSPGWQSFPTAQSIPQQQSVPSYVPPQGIPPKQSVPEYVPPQGIPSKQSVPSYAPPQGIPPKQSMPSYVPPQRPGIQSTVPSYQAAAPVMPGTLAPAPAIPLQSTAEMPIQSFSYRPPPPTAQAGSGGATASSAKISAAAQHMPGRTSAPTAPAVASPRPDAAPPPRMSSYDMSGAASPGSMQASAPSPQSTASRPLLQSSSPPSTYNQPDAMWYGSAALPSSSYGSYGPPTVSPATSPALSTHYADTGPELNQRPSLNNRIQDSTPTFSYSGNLHMVSQTGALPAAPQQKTPPPQKQPPIGWAMGIAAGARIRQAVERDVFLKIAWPKQRTTLLSVQILNAVAFEALTGMLAPPTPITAKLYKEYGFPFFAAWNSGDGVAADGAVNLAGLRSVGDLDAREPPKLGSSVEGGSKVACSVCRRMLCDTILRPCNHSFCSECIHTHMRHVNVVYCRLCRIRVTQLLGISGPMALPGEDTADLSNNKVITTDPFGGLWAFRSVGELEGDPGPPPAPAPVWQPAHPYELESEPAPVPQPARFYELQ